MQNFRRVRPRVTPLRRPASYPGRTVLDSTGPNGARAHGDATQVSERYVQMGRDAQASGDRVLAENFFQHADHYFRLTRGGDYDAYAGHAGMRGRRRRPRRGLSVPSPCGGICRPRTGRRRRAAFQEGLPRRRAAGPKRQADSREAIENSPRARPPDTRPEGRRPAATPLRGIRPQAGSTTPPRRDRWRVTRENWRGLCAAAGAPAVGPAKNEAPKSRLNGPRLCRGRIRPELNRIEPGPEAAGRPGIERIGPKKYEKIGAAA